MDTPKIIAEIGCNHKGSVEIASKMIREAATFCDVDVVKFQKRLPKELLSAEQYTAPHPNPHHAYGDSYGAHREKLELSIEEHKVLKEECDKYDVIYSSSVWDVSSAKEMLQLNPSFLKVPSACNLNKALLSFLADEYEGGIHLSLGMTSVEEEEAIVSFFEAKKRAQDLVLYACTSAYPVATEDLCLLEIKRLKESYSGIVQNIGFSGHHLGFAIDSVAFYSGATWIERHFTLDRTWKGTDHAASLEPDGMRRLCRNLRLLPTALTYKKGGILPCEEASRRKLKTVRSLMA